MTFRLPFTVLVAALTVLVGAASAQTEPWKFFALDNGVGRGDWSAAQQASVLKETGYDGITYNYTSPADLKQWLTELKARELQLFGIYLGVKLDGEPVLPPTLAEAMPLLRGSGAVLWLTVPKPAASGDYDAVAVKRVREVADLAATAGLRVVLYPHFAFHIATAEHALALLARVERANVGLSINLCHELASGNGARLGEIVRKVAPSLQMVSLNGATDRAGPGWNNYIKVLGTGDYDVSGFLRILREVNYTGPVGLQSYNVKGDPKDNLTSSRRAWTTLTAAAATP